MIFGPVDDVIGKAIFGQGHERNKSFESPPCDRTIRTVISMARQGGRCTANTEGVNVMRCCSCCLDCTTLIIGDINIATVASLSSGATAGKSKAFSTVANGTATADTYMPWLGLQKWMQWWNYQDYESSTRRLKT